jgi:hypothetical protein
MTFAFATVFASLFFFPMPRLSRQDTASNMDSDSDVSIGALRWGKSPVENTVQIDVASEVGDCFFACVSVWLNVYFGRTLFDPQRLRLSLAAAMAWPEASSVLDRVREDLSNYCDIPLNASLEEMQAVVMKSTTWADHPIISVLALFCSRITESAMGFLIFCPSQSGADTQVFTVAPPPRDASEEEDLEIACVLLLTSQEHYLLLADKTTREMVFDVKTVNWRGSSSGTAHVEDDADDAAARSPSSMDSGGGEDLSPRESRDFIAL